MSMCKMTRGLLKKQPKKLTWKNVYVLRQEYNKALRKWFPVVMYWRVIGNDSWVEKLEMNDHGFYHDEVSYQMYDGNTRPGTSKCDPADVSKIVEYHELEGFGHTSEVSKLGSYKPSNPNYTR